MKKLGLVLALALLLVACGTNAKEQEEHYETEIVRVDLEYKTIEEDDSDLLEGERKTVTEGKNGYKMVVYRIDDDCIRMFINEWTYEDPVHEVIKVGTKKDEVLVESNTSNQNSNNSSNQNNGDYNNSALPSQTGGDSNTGNGSSGGNTNTGGSGGGNTTPSNPDPKPPVNVCNVYEGNDGNGWWSTYESANNWAYDQMWNEDSPFFGKGYAVGDSEKGCGWFIYFY